MLGTTLRTENVAMWHGPELQGASMKVINNRHMLMVFVKSEKAEVNEIKHWQFESLNWT